MSEVYKLSPLDDIHRSLGAKMVAYAGWELPQRYGPVINEHQAVRQSAGVFDLSYLGHLLVTGEKAATWLDALLTNDVSALKPLQMQYSFVLNAKGGVIDDLMLANLGDEGFLLLTNACQTRKVRRWLEKHLLEGVTLADESTERAGLAVQGPDAPDIFSQLTGGRCLPAPQHIEEISIDGFNVQVGRLGYTGEEGFELYCKPRSIPRFFQKVRDLGATPCGLGARDTLRLEMGYPLSGVDLTPEHSPFEAGQSRFVSLTKSIDFVGKKALLKQEENGVPTKLRCLVLEKGSTPPTAGCAVFLEEESEEVIGKTTSAVLSPSLGHGIAMAYLAADKVKLSQTVLVEIRGKRFPAKVVRRPFYERSKAR